jgi:hypothetical protein
MYCRKKKLIKFADKERHKPYEMEKNETWQTADMYLVMCKVVLVRTSRDTKMGVGGGDVI